jgi:uncharacterized protein
MSLSEPGAVRPEPLRERLRRLSVLGTRTARSAAEPSARVMATAAGEGFEVVRARFALSHRHGHAALGESLSMLATDAGAEPSQTLWLDTETTGLAGGTGTYVFLVGLGFFDGPAFSVEQFLLRRLSAEGRFLSALLDRLDGARHLVTFNGRRFDWPLLETRFILTHLRPRPIDLHTDLVYPARRLWHRVLGTHRLTALEADVLGARRGDDMPGWMIPQVYVQYLRTSDRTALEPVLSHNRADLLALLTLHAHVARVLRNPDAARDTIDWEGAGVLVARGGNHHDAARCFERALSMSMPWWETWRVLRRCAREYRALGDRQRVRALWEDAAGRCHEEGRHRARVLVEVAKARERVGDAAGARRAAEEALRLVAAFPASAAPGSPVGVDSLRRRVARLARNGGSAPYG